MNECLKKKSVAILSVVSNIILSVLKLVSGVLTGSLSIISEAIHSMSDLFASMLTFYSVVKSSKPADSDHPYGHGRYEDMAGFIEGILIILASVLILYHAVKKIISGELPESESISGIVVMGIAVVMNFTISCMLFKVSKETNSVSLYADGQHLRTDVYSSLGVLVGLLLIKITGHVVLDPVIAILVAVFIYRTGYSISNRTLMNLLDHSLPKSEIEDIRRIVKGFEPEVKLKRNSIKARQTGPSRDIDLILQFPHETTICECHKICDEIEKKVCLLYPNCSISIHSEPVCYKKNCQKTCESKYSA